MKAANHILKLLVKRVYHVISRFKADKTLEPKPRTVRPPMTTKQDWMMSLKDCFETAMSLSCAFCE